MDIALSYNWLKEYLKIKDTPETFAKKVSLCGVGVERIHPQADIFKDMVVGVVKEILIHPNADKLKIVKVDVRGIAVNIVCGGSNLRVGMKVAVAMPGAQVRWHGKGELITLKATEIRGVKSVGMICAASEIGLSDVFKAKSEREIMDLSDFKAKAGTSLAAAMELDDSILDIEVTTNRIDVFSALGAAREAAAILNEDLTKEAQRILSTKIKVRNLELLPIKNQSPNLCSRYIGVKLENVTVKESPWWLKRRLMMSGIKVINNVVDVTNYVMLEIGQPLHAFDATKVQGGIVVRRAEVGEKLKTLDGRDNILAGSELVIADEHKVLALAGVMGGNDSAVSNQTTSIILEAATFNSVSVRKTARLHNLRTDAVIRFEKGLSEELAEVAMARAMGLFKELCGAKVVALGESYPNPQKLTHFVFQPSESVRQIGVKIKESTIVDILKRLGFGVKKKKIDSYLVTVPYFRRLDIETDRDFTEEIARIFGYHNLPAIMPSGVMPKNIEPEVFNFEERSKRYLEDSGFFEVMTYSFISEDDVLKSGLDPKLMLAVANPLSSDFVYLRASLLPGAMKVIKNNQGLNSEAKFFELSNVYLPKENNSELASEVSKLFLIKYGRGDREQSWRELKGEVENYLELMSVPYKFERDETIKAMHSGRSARIISGTTELGCLGELSPELSRQFGLDVTVIVAELDTTAVLTSRNLEAKFKPVPNFPPVLRDVALVVDEELEYHELELTLRGASPLLHSVELFDLYRSANLGKNKKSLALHLNFSDSTRTLTSEVVDQEMQNIISATKRLHQVEIRD